jgi:hypothetical protein
MRHNAKSKWLEVAAVMAAAHKYELKHGFKMRWYLCEECSYYHIATVTYNGKRVISLEAIQEKQKAGEIPRPPATK